MPTYTPATGDVEAIRLRGPFTFNGEDYPEGDYYVWAEGGETRVMGAAEFERRYTPKPPPAPPPTWPLAPVTVPYIPPVLPLAPTPCEPWHPNPAPPWERPRWHVTPVTCGGTTVSWGSIGPPSRAGLPSPAAGRPSPAP